MYVLIALCFAGLLGVVLVNARDSGTALREQKKIELRHLTELALGIVAEEHAAVGRGSVTVEEAKRRAAARIERLRYDGSEYFWINDMEHRLVMHPLRPERVGQDVSGLKDATGRPLYPRFVDVARQNGSGFVDYDQNKPGVEAPQPKLSFVAGFAPWGWVVGTGVYIDDLAAQTRSGLLRSLATVAILFLVIAAFSALIVRNVTTPLRNLNGAMRELAGGNFGVEIYGTGRRDEVGEIARSVAAFKVRFAERARQEQEAKADATAVAAARRRADMNGVADRFETAVGGILGTVATEAADLEAAAAALDRTVHASRDMSATLRAASEKAAENVRAVAAATDTMSTAIGEIGRRVRTSSRVADEAVKQAEATDVRVDELAKAARRIGDVVKLITAIAEQTNLLALNATIEAARAGEAGKGFAVVAQEVKALAAQTARATGDVSAQIAGMQAATQESVAAIAAIGGTIGEIAQTATAIATAVEEQGAATAEIARNIAQAATGTAEIASSVNAVNRGAEETSVAAVKVLSSAHALSSDNDRLRNEVDAFLDTVRAA
jgi:methyl-accepting chemotaxis protein